MDEQAGKNLKKIHRLAVISCGMMIGAIVLYGAVAWMVVRNTEPHKIAYFAVVQGILWVIAAAEFAVSFRLKKDFRERLPAQTVSSMPVEVYSSALLRASILGFAACELIAINGLVLTLLSRDFLHFVLFAALAALGFFLHAPKLEEWEAWFQKKQNTGV